MICILISCINSFVHAGMKISIQECEKGNAMSCFIVGNYYENGGNLDGDKVEIDYSLAVKYFMKGCKGGVADSCNDLGLMYMNGTGVKQDYQTANKYFRKSCADGSMYGCTNLGVNYHKGYGFTLDFKIAAKFYKKGCDSGLSIACKKLHLVTEIISSSSTMPYAIGDRVSVNDKYRKGVCVKKSGRVALGLIGVTMKGFIEDVSSNNIKIRISDTEGQNINYKGNSIYKGDIIWDNKYSWTLCN